MAWFRRKATENVYGSSDPKRNFYGDRGDATAGGFYMSDSGMKSAEGGPDPLVRDVRGSSQESSRFVLTPVQSVRPGDFKQIKNAVEGTPGKFYVSDIKLIQRDEDLPGIYTPAVDVAIAQENVPLTDQEAFNIQNNQKGGGMTVWQHTAMTASALENAKISGEIREEGIGLPNDWQNKLKADSVGGGKSAVRDAETGVKFDGALMTLPSNTPDYVAHLRPGGANRGDDMVGAFVQEAYGIPTPKSQDGEIGSQYPIADLYQVNQSALDNRAGHLSFVGSVPFDDADTKNVGQLSGDAAMLPLKSQDMRNDQKGLALNYNSNELNNPFGGKVGKFVALDAKTVEEGPITLSTVNNANNVNVGFRLDKDKDYAPLKGYSRVFGRLRAGELYEDKKQKGSFMMFTRRGANSGAVDRDNTISNAAILEFNGKDRKQFLESTSKALNKAAQTEEQKQIVNSLGKPWRRKKK